jgi:TetR/AcrR family transcriptional repressor of nem operon
MQFDETKRNTATRILDVAQELMQARGYNGFSFHDIARRLGVRSATVHYHYPSKGDLALAVVIRQQRQLADALARINDSNVPPRSKIERFIQIAGQGGRAAGRLTLVAVLAAESDSLPDPVRAQVRAQLRDTLRWISGVLEGGSGSGVAAESETLPAAAALHAALHGMILHSAVASTPELARAVERWFVENLFRQPGGEAAVEPSGGGRADADRPVANRVPL